MLVSRGLAECLGRGGRFPFELRLFLVGDDVVVVPLCAYLGLVVLLLAVLPLAVAGDTRSARVWVGVLPLRRRRPASS